MNYCVFAVLTGHKMKYLYLTPSSTSKITILLDKILIEELTGWLTVNNGEIVRIEKPRKKKNQRQVSLLFKKSVTTRL